MLNGEILAGGEIKYLSELCKGGMNQLGYLGGKEGSTDKRTARAPRISSMLTHFERHNEISTLSTLMGLSILEGKQCFPARCLENESLTKCLPQILHCATFGIKRYVILLGRVF